MRWRDRQAERVIARAQAAAAGSIAATHQAGLWSNASAKKVPATKGSWHQRCRTTDQRADLPTPRTLFVRPPGRTAGTVRCGCCSAGSGPRCYGCCRLQHPFAAVGTGRTVVVEGSSRQKQAGPTRSRSNRVWLRQTRGQHRDCNKRCPTPALHSGVAAADFGADGRDDLVEVSEDGVVGPVHHVGLGVSVDGENLLRCHRPHPVLDGA